MKKVPLQGKNGEGLFCLVDDDDFEEINKHKWYYHDGYAITVKHLSGSHSKKNIKQKNIVMHRLVMGVADYHTGHMIDHINRNRLDNRKENLRFVDYFENAHNSAPVKGASSQYKGVVFNKAEGKWDANCLGKFLGSFSEEKVAALAYDKAARFLLSEHAYVNFSDEFLPIDILLPHVDREPKLQGTTSKYVGVCWYKKDSCWRANYKHKHLGYFNDEEAARRAYLRAKNEDKKN